jgi:hypothetical protein
VGILDRPFQARTIHGGHFGDDLCSGGIPDGKMLFRRHELPIEIKRIDFHFVAFDLFTILIQIATLEPEDCNFG